MRCRACNAMMAAVSSKHGGFEDLCSRCRSWAYSTDIDDDFKRMHHDSLVGLSLSEAVVVSELGISLDLSEYSDNIDSWDRNHESTDLFESYND